jgi:hypothetical protein
MAIKSAKTQAKAPAKTTGKAAAKPGCRQGRAVENPDPKGIPPKGVPPKGMPPKAAAKPAPAKPLAAKAAPAKAPVKLGAKPAPAKPVPEKTLAGKAMAKLVAKFTGKSAPVAKGSPEKMQLSKAALTKAAAKVDAKAKAGNGKEETAEKEGESGPDAPLPLLDLSDAAVKKMIKGAKKRGYVTYEQLNAVMPSEEVTSEQIEDTLSMLSEMGINVIEQEDAEASDEEKEDDDDDEGGELVEVSAKPLVKSEKEPSERTDDPVRMYLREMGSVELLSREGEIAIAKRIEAGREAMIAGLCESPLTFQAIIIWRDELNEGKVFLRDIIDLEATYAGPDAKLPAPVGPDGPAAAACARRHRPERDPAARLRQPAAAALAAVGAGASRRRSRPRPHPAPRRPKAKPRRIRPRPPPKPTWKTTSSRIRSRSPRSRLS